MSPTTIRIMVDQRDGSMKEIGSIQINDGKVTNTAREDVIIKDPTGREAITTLSAPRKRG